MEPDIRATRRALEQGGVIRLGQALDAGMTFKQVRLRVDRGSWTRVSAGLYRVFDGDSALERTCAAIAALPGATASFQSAAAMHELGGVPAVPATVSVHSRTTHVFPGVVVRRCHDLAEWHVTTLNGTEVTTPERTIVDLAQDLSSGQVGYILDDAVASRKASLPEVERVLRSVARRGKPGVTTMRTVLEARLDDPGEASVLERRALRLLRSAGLEGRVEYPIPWSPTHRFDLAFPIARVAVEWDSRRWHSQVDAFERDRRRDRDCALNGWVLMRFTWADVVDRPDSVVAAIRTILSDRTGSAG